MTDNKLKIIMATYHYPTPTSRGRKFFLRDHAFITAMIANTVVCDNSLNFDQPFSFLRRRGPDSTGAIIDEWILNCSAGNNITRKAFMLLWLILSAVHLTKTIFREKPAVVIQHFFTPNGIVPAFLSRFLKFKYIIVNHASSLNPYLKSRFKYAVLRYVQKKATEIWHVSAPQFDKFREHIHTQRNYIFGNPINTKRYIHDPTTHKVIAPLTVLNIAMPSHRKGTDLLIDAARILKRKKLVAAGEFRIHIIGGGPWDHDFLKMAVASQVNDIIVFKGFVDEEMLLHEMQDCDFVVHQSRDEGFSYAVAESLACGKPVLTTACGGPEWFVTPDLGIVIESDNADSLVEGFEKMLATYTAYDPAHLHTAIDERFGYRAMADKMRERLQQIVSKTV